MKKLLFFLCQILLSLHSSGQIQNQITIGIRDSIDSNILNEQRIIWVHIPDGYAPDKNYPVLYLLDGSANFHTTVGLLSHLSQYGNTICPEMVVVGILNTNRTRDLTPYKPNPVPAIMPGEMVEESGGGEAFISFIQDELIPYIDSKYPTTSYRRSLALI